MQTIIIYDGPVDHIIAMMWSKRFEPETAGARFVVSESGDILFPRYAPEMITPGGERCGNVKPGCYAYERDACRFNILHARFLRRP